MDDVCEMHVEVINPPEEPGDYDVKIAQVKISEQLISIRLSELERKANASKDTATA